MANASGQISSPVKTIADVLAVLGITHTADTGKFSYICSNIHGKINKWARHKPVRYQSTSHLTEAQFDEVNYGLAVSTTRYTDPITAATTEAYVYQPPTGGASSPYRIGDFDKYLHSALAPCRGAGDFEISSATTAYEFGCGININGSDNLIGLAEINSTLEDYYLAMIVRYTVGGNTYVRYACADDKIGNYGHSISVNLTQGIFQNRESIRNYEYWFCGANTKPSNPDGAGFAVVGGYFMPLPFASTSESSGHIIFSSSLGVGISVGALEYSNYVCGYWVTFHNPTSSSYTVPSGSSVTVRMLAGNTYIEQDGYTRTHTTSQKIVPAGDSSVIIGTANPSLPLPNVSFDYSGKEQYRHNCKIEVTAVINGHTYTASAYAGYNPE